MPLQLPCPELELRHSAASWLPCQPVAQEVNTSIDFLELQGRDLRSLDAGGVTYQTGLGHQEVVDHLGSPQESGANQSLRILFVNGKLSRPRALADFEDIHSSISRETADYLQDHLGVSPLFLATVLRKSWVLKSGNCHWVGEAEEPVVEGWYRYSCGLRSFPSYVWYSYKSNRTTYIVTNGEYNGVQDAIVRCVNEGMGELLLRPLAVDGFIAEASSEGWGEEILRPRKTLIHYEHVDDNGIDTRESVKELHVLSYNLLIIREDMTDHIERLEYLLDVHKTLECTFGTFQRNKGVSLEHSLSFLLSETRNRKRWVDCYSKRTGIQINLWYNLSSQKDNKTNLKIADFTSKIATETQKDSSSMITMAAVTMAFLPGTFVSALFSMVFFETNTLPDGRTSLSVGASWWLFPTITIPLTIAVFAIWHIWRARRNARQMNELRRMEEPYDTFDQQSEYSDPAYIRPRSSLNPGGFPSLDGFEKDSPPISPPRNMTRHAPLPSPPSYTHGPRNSQDSYERRSLAVVQPAMTLEELHRFQKREESQDGVPVPGSTTEGARISLKGRGRLERDHSLPVAPSSAAPEEVKATTVAVGQKHQLHAASLTAPGIHPLQEDTLSPGSPNASDSAAGQPPRRRMTTEPIEAQEDPPTSSQPFTTSKALPPRILESSTTSNRSYPHPVSPPSRLYPNPSLPANWSRSPAHALDQYSMARRSPGGLGSFTPTFIPSIWSDPAGSSPVAAWQCYPTMDEFKPSASRRPFAARQSPLTVDEFRRDHWDRKVVPPTEGPAGLSPDPVAILAAATERRGRAGKGFAVMNPDMTLEEYRAKAAANAW